MSSMKLKKVIEQKLLFFMVKNLIIDDYLKENSWSVKTIK